MFGSSANVLVYEDRGSVYRWKRVKSALQEAGIRGLRADHRSEDLTVPSCCAGKQLRQSGRQVDNDVYRIYVQERDADRAREIVEEELRN